MSKLTFLQSRIQLSKGINLLKLPTGHEVVCADSFFLYYLAPIEETDNLEEIEILVADHQQGLTLEDSIGIQYVDSFLDNEMIYHVYKIHKPTPTMRLIDESN